ncbi:RHS repeat protein [Lysobacter sp. K5869]|uniref:RHS repeat-associated core domain-containing protein n=1 Tax=Lysobacter sp. K5869 TaxID=2820808 RepID=UPI001C0623D0|nr:RHS repeat-associated core domain-containing protein [Lysobacter sp. K5869]QWP77213.1 RHS repeat protein [Lysobacter sp. K5869]
MTETGVELTYGIPNEIGQVRDWNVFSAIYTGTYGLPNQQALIDAVKAKLDQKSIADGCTPSTTVAQDGTWGTWYTWSDGVASAELVRYRLSSIRKSSGQCQVYNDTDTFTRARPRCSAEHMTWVDGNVCVPTSQWLLRVDANPLYCDKCSLVGNPIDFSTGDKYQAETDLDLGWISFTRYYHSAGSAATSGFGEGWSHSHDTRLALSTDSPPSNIGLIQANGSNLPFHKFEGYYEAVDGSGDRIIASGSNWLLHRGDRTLTFNADGMLTEDRGDDGLALTYEYDVVKRLATIRHSTGRSLVLTYDGQSAVAPVHSLSVGGQVKAEYTYNSNGQVQTAVYVAGGKRTYHYEDIRFPTHLTGISDDFDRRFSTYGYDDQGRGVSSVHAGGVDSTTVVYSSTGGASITDALGHVTTYGLDGAGSTDKPRKAGGVEDNRGTIQRSYFSDSVDFRRRLSSVTDLRGIRTDYVYSEANDTITGALSRTLTMTEAVGTADQRISTATTDVASNRPLVSRVGNRETRIARNARLQPISVSVRDTETNEARTTSYSYCEAGDIAAANSTCPILGLLKSVDGPRTDIADVTTFEYYGSDDSTCVATPELCTYRKGDLRKATDALGHVTQVLGYDPDGHAISVLDPNGVVIDSTYSPRGWRTKTKLRGSDDSTELDDRITTVDYFLGGLVHTVTTPSEMVTFDYDTALRLNGISSAGEYIDYTLDNAGHIKKQEVRSGSGLLTQTMSQVFNALGQLEVVKDSAQNPTSYLYDKSGNAKEVTDALGRKALHSYDSFDRLSESLQKVTLRPNDPIEDVRTTLKYNALDQVTQVVDPNNLTTVYTYNGFGDRIRLTSPDTGITDYTYNAAGFMATKKDGNDAVAHRYTYDALNRPKAVFYATSGPADVEYDYDTVNTACAAGETFALGRVTAMRANGTELQYCYDRFGQVVRKVQRVGGQSFTLRYAYDRAGRVSVVTYPDGAVAEYFRGAFGRIADIRVTPAGGVRTQLLGNVIYQPFGPSLGWTYGNGRYISRDYDLDYRPKTILDSASGGLSLGYIFNEVGEIQELKNGLLSTSLAKYDHDELGRLTKTLYGISPIETYTYDKTGNRLSLTDGGGQQVYEYVSGTRRLDKVANVARSYDAVGNTASIGGVAREFAYDANGRLSEAKQNGIVKASYRYNARGERVSVSNAAGAVDTYTLYDETGNWIGDYDATGAAKQQVVWLDNAPAGLLVGTGATQSLVYVQTDHLGTPRALIDPVRNVAVWNWSAKSEAFGSSPPNQDPDLDGTEFVFDMRFPGQRYDAATGLSYNYYRDYDAVTGRYIQSDPIGLAGGISTYGYASAAPLEFMDPLGLANCTLIFARGEGRLQCTPDNPGNAAVDIPVASGNNGGGTNCKNNPACETIRRRGPIPSGCWRWTTEYTSKPNGRALAPCEGTDTHGRTLIRSHSCINAFGPSKNAPFCSEGCVTGAAADIRLLNALIDAEPNSTLQVGPVEQPQPAPSGPDMRPLIVLLLMMQRR